MTPPTEVILDDQNLPVSNPNFKDEHKNRLMQFITGESTDEPSLWAVDPGEWRELSKIIPGLIVQSAGGLFPFQSEGTLKGYPYYFRYRHGWVSLKVYEPEHELSSTHILWEAGQEYGDEYGGTLDNIEFARLMMTLVPNLTKGSFLWTFEGDKVNVSQDSETQKLIFTLAGKKIKYSYLAENSNKAYKRLSEPSAYLEEHGWSKDDQNILFQLQNIDPIPTNQDTRVYPNPQPRFEINL